MTVLPGTAGVTLGVKRGGIQLRQSLIYLPDLFQLLFFPAVTIRAVPDVRPARPRHDVLPRHQLVSACGLLHPVRAQAGSPIAAEA